MGRNWAIAIGVNQYEFLQPLEYAKRDAELMKQFLQNEAGFDRVYFFADDSPPNDGRSTRPIRANLRRVLREMFENPFLGAGDNFWFFFSGHGMRHEECDYLMPADGDPADVKDTAIPINYITERLRRCGADNVVLMLDACRSQGTRSGEGIGNQTAEEAREKGVISVFSCSPSEVSYEISELQQGTFTKALLEGLGIQGQCATVARLNEYLKVRVSELNAQYNRRSRQTPYIVAEPLTKSHLILLPKYATPQDILMLKCDALQAELSQDWQLAEQLWIRVIAASQGTDLDAIRALQRIALVLTKSATVQPKSASEVKAKSETMTSTPQLETEVLAAEIEKAAPDPDVPMVSERGVDYTRLRDLLAAGKWEEADEETAMVMLKAADREKQGWLGDDDIKKFPCADLRTIDQLWVKYSNGHFGFSVQKRIYQSLGGTKKFDREIWEAFGDRVGWRKEGEWRLYSDLTFNLNSPVGHLPWVGCVMRLGVDWFFCSLFSRRDL